MTMDDRSNPARAPWWCGLAFGGSLLAMAGVVGAIGYSVTRPASAPDDEAENARAIGADELDWKLIVEHRSHMPGECRYCDWYRDWEARPPVDPAD